LTPYNQIDDYGQEKSWKMQKQALSKRKSQLASVVEVWLPIFFFNHLSSAQILVLMFLFEQDAVEAADLRKYSSRTRDSLSCWNPDSIGFNLIENVLCHICQKERAGAVLVFMTGWDDINALKEQLQANPLLGDPGKVLLLACHGSMASSEQVSHTSKLLSNKIMMCLCLLAVVLPKLWHTLITTIYLHRPTSTIKNRGNTC
jgi:ATP-dependent RNA helicase DHX36